jgi:hypothetical protein
MEVSIAIKHVFHWASQNGPKKVYKGPQVGRMYGPMSMFKNKPLTKSLGPFS